MAPRRRLVILTERECQVAAGVGRNLSYAQIGERLGIAEATVRTHVRSIARRLEVPKGVERPPEPKMAVYSWVMQQGVSWIEANEYAKAS